MKLEDDCFLAEKWWKTEQCVENQRHYPANKGLYGQGYSLPSGHMWLSELDSEEGRMPKKWCFWTVCWRRFLKVPWRARRSNQPILREINPEYSLEGLVLKLKLQYFGHLMQATHGKSSWCWQRQGRRKRGLQRMRWLDGITDTMSMNLGKLQAMVRNREAWHATVHKS